MTYNILIVGLKGQDAGKTTFALALLAYLREKGHNACAFKPRAGNNVWYDFDIVHDALSQGRLYGKDATRLKAASEFRAADDPLSEECINPIHRLWMEPPRINSLSQIPGFIIDRVTLWTKDGARTLVVENETLPAMYKCSDTLIAQLRANASEIYHVRDLNTLNKLTEEYYDLAIELAYKKVVAQHDCVVIESYSDIALPCKGLNNLDAVIGVKPGRISAFDPRKYLAAVQIAAATYSQEELPTARIIELLKPLKEVHVAPCRSEKLAQGLQVLIPRLMPV
ncbi:MAG: hypothetical protein U9R10_04810 [Euryarchaeota archaeon]|nr:hypothetical protein [Euryarchaeota archaeon]